jgi:hypothetical protein
MITGGAPRHSRRSEGLKGRYFFRSKYLPLEHHFEQQYHVRYRLDRYKAGRCLRYSETGVDALADAIATEIGRPVDYRDVETDGAARAADLIAELL